MTEKTKPKRTFASVTANYFARDRALLEQEGIAKAANEQEAEQRARYLKEQERRQEEEDNRSGLNKQFDSMRREAEASFTRRPVKVRSKDGVTIVPESDKTYDAYLQHLSDNVNEVNGSFYLSKKAIRGLGADFITLSGAASGAIDPTYTAMEGVRDAGDRADAVLLNDDFVNKLYAVKYARWQEKKNVDLGESRKLAELYDQRKAAFAEKASSAEIESYNQAIRGMEAKGHKASSWWDFAKENKWGVAGDLTQEAAQELGSAILSKGAFAPIRAGTRSVVADVAKTALKDAPKLRAAVTDARIVTQAITDTVPAKLKGAAEVTAQTTLASAVETYDAHANTYLDTKDQLTQKYIDEGIGPEQARIRAAMEANQIAIGGTLANIGSEALFGGASVERLLRGKGGRVSVLKTSGAEGASEGLSSGASTIWENKVLGNELGQNLSDNVQQGVVLGMGSGGAIAGGMKAGEAVVDYREGSAALQANDLANKGVVQSAPVEVGATSATPADVKLATPKEDKVKAEKSFSGLVSTGNLSSQEVDEIRKEAFRHLDEQRITLAQMEQASPQAAADLETLFNSKKGQIREVTRKLENKEQLTKEEEVLLDQFTDQSQSPMMLGIRKRLERDNEVAVTQVDEAADDTDYANARMATNEGKDDLEPVVRLSKKTASIRQTYVLGKMLRQMSTEDRKLVNEAFAKGTLEIYDNLSTDSRARVSGGKVSVNIKNFTGRNEFMKAFTKLKDEKDIADKLSTFESTVRHEARHLVFDRTGKYRKDLDEKGKQLDKAGPEEAHAKSYVERAVNKGVTDETELTDLYESEKEAFSEEIIDIASKNKKARKFLVQKTAEKHGMSEKDAKRLVDFRVAVYQMDKQGVNNSLRALIEDAASTPTRQALIPEKAFKTAGKSPYQLHKAVANAVAGEGDDRSIKTLRKYFGDAGKKMSDDDLKELVDIVNTALPYYNYFKTVPDTTTGRKLYSERLAKLKKLDPEMAGFVTAAISGKDMGDAALMADVSNVLREPTRLEVNTIDGDTDAAMEADNEDLGTSVAESDASYQDLSNAGSTLVDLEKTAAVDELADDEDWANASLSDSDDDGEETQESIDKRENAAQDADIAAEAATIAEQYADNETPIETGLEELKAAKEKLDSLYSQYQIQMHPATGLPVARNKVSGAFFHAMRSKLRSVRSPGVVPTYKEELSVADVMAAKGDTDLSGMRKALTDLSLAVLNGKGISGGSDLAWLISKAREIPDAATQAGDRRYAASKAWEDLPKDASIEDRARAIENILMTYRAVLLAKGDATTNKIFDRLAGAAALLRVVADPTVGDLDALNQSKLVAAVPANEVQELRESLATAVLNSATDADTLRNAQEAEVVSIAEKAMDDIVTAVEEIDHAGYAKSYSETVRKYGLTLPRKIFVTTRDGKVAERFLTVTNIAPLAATDKATKVYLPIKKGTPLFDKVEELAKVRAQKVATATSGITLAPGGGTAAFFSDLGRKKGAGFRSRAYLPVNIQTMVDGIVDLYPSIPITEKNIGALFELVYGVRPVVPYGTKAKLKFPNKYGTIVSKEISLGKFAVVLKNGKEISAEEHKVIRGDYDVNSASKSGTFDTQKNLSAGESLYMFASSATGAPVSYPGGALAMTKEAIENLVKKRGRLLSELSNDNLNPSEFDALAKDLETTQSKIENYTKRAKALAIQPEREEARVQRSQEEDVAAYAVEALSSGEFDQDLYTMQKFYYDTNDATDNVHRLKLAPPKSISNPRHKLFTEGLHMQELEDLVGTERLNRLLQRAGIGPSGDMQDNEPDMSQFANPSWTYRPQKRARFTMMKQWVPTETMSELNAARLRLAQFDANTAIPDSMDEEARLRYDMQRGDLSRAVKNADAKYRAEIALYSFKVLTDTIKYSDLSLQSQQATFDQYTKSGYQDTFNELKKAYNEVGFPAEATDDALTEALPLVPIVSVFLPPAQYTDSADQEWLRTRIKSILDKGAIIAVPRGTASSYFSGAHEYAKALGLYNKEVEIVRDDGIDYLRKAEASSLLTLEEVINLKKSLASGGKKSYTSYKDDLSNLAATLQSNQNLQDRLIYSSGYTASKYHAKTAYRKASTKYALEILDSLYPTNSPAGVYVNGVMITELVPGKFEDKLIVPDKRSVAEEKLGLDVLPKIHTSLNATRDSIIGKINSHLVSQTLQRKLVKDATVKRLADLGQALELVDNALLRMHEAKQLAAADLTNDLVRVEKKYDKDENFSGYKFAKDHGSVLSVHELMLMRDIPFDYQEAAVREEGYKIIDDINMTTAPYTAPYSIGSGLMSGNKYHPINTKLGSMVFRPSIGKRDIYSGKYDLEHALDRTVVRDEFDYVTTFGSGDNNGLSTAGSWQDVNKTPLARLEKRQPKDPQANFDRNGKLKPALSASVNAKVLYNKELARRESQFLLELQMNELHEASRKKQENRPKIIGRTGKRNEITREAAIVRDVAAATVDGTHGLLRAVEVRAATNRAKRFAENLRNSEMMDINTLSSQISAAIDKVAPNRRKALQDSIAAAMTLDVTGDMYAEVMRVTRDHVAREFGINGSAAMDAALRLRDKYLKTKQDIINLVSEIPGADTNELAKNTLRLLEKTMYSYMTTSYSIHNIHAGEGWRRMITDSINAALGETSAMYATDEGIAMAREAAQALIDASNNNEMLLGFKPDGRATMAQALTHLRDSFLAASNVASFEKSSSRTVFSEGTANLRETKTLVGPQMAPFRALLGESKSLAVRLNTTAQVITHLRSQAEFLSQLYKEGIAVQVDSEKYNPMMVALNAEGIGRNVFGNAFSNLAVDKHIKSIVQDEIVVTGSVRKAFNQLGALDKATAVLTSPAIWGASITGNLTHVPLIAAMRSAAPAESGSYTARTTRLMKYLLEQAMPTSGNPTFTTPPEGHPVRKDYLNMIAGGYVDSAFRMEDLQLALREIQKQDPEVLKALSEGFLDTSNKARLIRMLMSTKSLSSQGMDKLGTVFSLMELPAKIALHMGHMDALRSSKKYKDARQDRLAAAAGEMVINDIPSAANIPKFIKGFEQNFITRFLGFFWVTGHSMFVGKLRNIQIMHKAGVQSKYFYAYVGGSGAQLYIGTTGLAYMLGGALQMLLDALMEPPEYPPTEEQQRAVRDAWIRYYEDRDPNSKYVHIGWDKNGNPALVDVSFYASLYQQQTRLLRNIARGLSGDSTDLFVDSLLRDMPLGAVGDSVIASVAPTVNSMVDSVEDSYAGKKNNKTAWDYVSGSGGLAGLTGAYINNDMVQVLGIRPTYADISVTLSQDAGRMFAMTKSAQESLVKAWKKDPTLIWTPEMVKERTATRLRSVVDVDRRLYALATDYSQALGFSGPTDPKFLDLVAPHKDDNMLRKYLANDHNEEAAASKMYALGTFEGFSNGAARSSEVSKIVKTRPNLNGNLVMNGLLSLMEATERAGTYGTPVEVKFDAVRVKDGDTFFARIEGKTYEVRPMGMDAPEKSQAEGAAATAELNKVLSSGASTGILIKDPKTGEYKQDEDGRLLADVRVNTAPLPELMQGMVYTFIPGARQPENVKHPRYIKAEQNH